MGDLEKFGLSDLEPMQPVLIAGPTAAGKSGLAMAIAKSQGGIIINADASQIYDCWRVITACPSEDDEASVAHALYRHVDYNAGYSTGHWLRDVEQQLSNSLRPIIVGGTGLYFSALTRGLAEIPPTPAEIRNQGNKLAIDVMLAEIDRLTKERIDTANRARVQRAWEVQSATGRGIAIWQDETPPPLLKETDCYCIAIEAKKDWLDPRIEHRFDLMIANGAMNEIVSMNDRYDLTLPSCRAIGVPELIKYHQGEYKLDEAKEAACTATRQYAKRQRTWFRSKMKNWKWLDAKAIY